MLDTVRDYALERLAESGGLAAARKAHAEYFATMAEAARPKLRGAEWLTGLGTSLDHDNLWAALTYARDAPDPPSRSGSVRRWAGTSRSPIASPRGAASSRSRSHNNRRRTAGLRIELLAWLCFLATEELDFDAAVEAGQRARAYASTSAPSESALLRVTLAIALTHGGDFKRAAAFADEARAGYDKARDDWGVALSSLVGAGVATGTGDVCTVAAMAAKGRRHSEAIGYDAFLPAAMLFEAWVAERHNDQPRRTPTAALSTSRTEPRLRDHASFALAKSSARSRCPRRRQPSRRARAAGARRRRGGTGAMGRGARSRPARPRARGGRRHRHRGEALPERRPVVGDGAAARGS